MPYLSCGGSISSEPTTGIYGVEWSGTSQTSWLRTDDAALFVDPNPYYSGMSGTPSSPFDEIMPWSGMEIVDDTDAGKLVSIPKFWYKITQNASTHDLKIQIANGEVEGFSVSPAHMDRGDGKGERDVVYVGRYHCDSTTKKSVTGVTPYNNKTRPTMRTAIHNLGSTIWMMDFATWFTIWLLYLVEFADWNSQDKIGYGCGDNSAAGYMGYTDNMPYHTGTTQSSRTTYGLGTQYRHIEGLWDNVLDWTDGCYYNSYGLNIILNPANFSDSSGGIAVGIPTNGNPSQFTLKEVNGTYPLIIPTANSGSNSTYSCDYWQFSPARPCLCVGGYYIRTNETGIFCVYAETNADTFNGYGSRLMKLP